jgi:hypothetical protein
LTVGHFLDHPPKEWPYVWWWRSVLSERKGLPCKVTARGKLNSVRVEFPDGLIVITSRFAIRKRKPVGKTRMEALKK